MHIIVVNLTSFMNITYEDYSNPIPRLRQLGRAPAHARRAPFDR